MAGSTSDTVLLLSCGLVTAVPLMLYANGAKLLRLSTIGIMQYIAPTMIFLTAVFVFGEPFGRGRMIAFPMIWTALVIYTVSMVRQARALGTLSAGGFTPPKPQMPGHLQLPRGIFSQRGWTLGAADLAAADGCRHAGGAGGGGGQAVGHAGGEVGEGLRLEHVAVEACGFNRLDRRRSCVAQFGHHRRRCGGRRR